MKTQYNILIIEDNKAIARLLEKKINEDELLAALVARDGEEALKKLEEEAVDLVLLDIDLPLISGLVIADKIKKSEAWKNIPIIIISNSGSPQDVAQMARIGVEDYFIKTDLHPAQIVKKIKKQLGITNSKKILFVEDNKFLRDLLVKKLTSQGFTILEAVDGEAALRILEQEEGITMILLDLVLPEMDGFEVLEKIKANPKYKKLPIIVVSNLGQEVEIQRALKLGAADYIIKANFTPSAIVKKIKEHFQR